ncbi:MAG TPA: amino acid ABC transporter permease, partial [Jiangellales bacterium]|nr:amino acid ABC transporter permease [Jiangellales bacterium]
MTSVLYDVPGPKARRRNRIGSVLGALLLLGIGAWVVWRLYENGIFEARRWEIFQDPDVWRFLWRGLWATLQAAGLAAVLALLLGFVLAVWRM